MSVPTSGALTAGAPMGWAPGLAALALGGALAWPLAMQASSFVDDGALRVLFADEEARLAASRHFAAAVALRAAAPADAVVVVWAHNWNDVTWRLRGIAARLLVPRFVTLATAELAHEAMQRFPQRPVYGLEIGEPAASLPLPAAALIAGGRWTAVGSGTMWRLFRLDGN